MPPRRKQPQRHQRSTAEAATATASDEDGRDDRLDDRLEAPATPPPVHTAGSCATNTSGCNKFTVGMKVHHIILECNGMVNALPHANDFMHRNMVLIQYVAIEKKVKVIKERWCNRMELEPVRTSPRIIERVDEPVTAKRPFHDTHTATPAVNLEMHEMAQRAPELADHERGRHLKQKVDTGSSGSKWGICGNRKTAETSVPIEERIIKAFPNQSFIAAASHKGKVLFCQCCPKTLQNLTSTIKAHISSERHAKRLELWLTRATADDGVCHFLHEYFKAHPNEKDSSVSADLQLYRWRVVEACMAVGVPLHKIDGLRILLERSGNALTDSSNLKAFIPKIEEFEFQRILEEVKGQQVCVDMCLDDCLLKLCVHKVLRVHRRCA